MWLVVCRGQYSDAVLSELENQNDEQLEGMSAKVKMLKDVRLPPSLPPLPHAANLALCTSWCLFLSSTIGLGN